MEYRSQPQSIEAEQGILGCMLLDSKVANKTISILDEEDFISEQHKKIYKAIVHLTNTSKPVDIVSVAAQDNDIEYLIKLTELITTTSSAKHYINVVKGKSIRRKYIAAAQQVIDAAYEGEYENVIDFKNDMLQKMDIEIKDTKKESSSIKDITLNTLGEIEKRYQNKDSFKMLYGFSWLDSMTGGAHNTDLTILAARPSVGKTAFALQIALNIAQKDNKVAIFNLEMGKDQLNERIISNEARVNSKRIRYGKTLTDKDWEQIAHAAGEIAELPVKIFDTVFKIEEIRGICRELKNNNELDFVVVDYLQLCDTVKKCSTENERISHLSRQFKLLAKELKVPIWLLSQLNRANEHDNRRPKLIDLRASGSIEQDADNVMFLHDENYGKYKEDDTDTIAVPVELIMAKQRNGQRDLYCEIGFIKAYQRFVDITGDKTYEETNRKEVVKSKKR